MLRDAILDDSEFICDLILSEAKAGHFVKELLDPVQSTFLSVDTNRIIQENKRSNGESARALIWEENRIPIGFMILSSVQEGQGTELWMMAMSKEHRSMGKGKKFIDEVLSYFPSTQAIGARCFAASDAMCHILTTRNFKLITTDEYGTRILCRNLTAI